MHTEAMPQAQLPIFPFSSTAITGELAFENRDGMVYYFNGHLPVVCHGAEDLASFRLYTSQFIANGNASQKEISEAFGVPIISVKRALKTFREKGAAGFFRSEAPRQGRRLTPEVLLKAQAELDAGRGVPAIARELQVLPNTLHKAIDDGRLKKKSPR